MSKKETKNYKKNLDEDGRGGGEEERQEVDRI